MGRIKANSQASAVGRADGGPRRPPSVGRWVWKQRVAVTRFMIAFHLRRALRPVGRLLAPLLGIGDVRQRAPLPTRRRRPGNQAQAC